MWTVRVIQENILARKSKGFIITFALDFSLLYFGSILRDLLREIFTRKIMSTRACPWNQVIRGTRFVCGFEKKTCPYESRLITFSYLRELCGTDCRGVCIDCIVCKRRNRLILPSGWSTREVAFPSRARSFLYYSRIFPRHRLVPNFLDRRVFIKIRFCICLYVSKSKIKMYSNANYLNIFRFVFKQHNNIIFS